MGTGTSQGVPVIGCKCETCLSTDERDKRLRCSILIQSEIGNVVIDAGPDFRQQMLRAKVDKLDAVVFTHEHNDHVIGLDDVRPFNFMNRANMPMYATKRVQKELITRFAYAFDANPYPGAPRIELHTITKENAFEVAGIPLQPIEVSHGRLPVLGFRTGPFTYLTDVKTIEAEELEKVKDTEILILNALHFKPHHSHLNVEEALELIEIIQPKQAYLTHISHRMGLYKKVNPTLPKGVSLAYDGLEIQF